MAANTPVKAGWDFATKYVAGGAGVGVGVGYVDGVEQAIEQLNAHMNDYAGHQDSIATLKGFSAEEWHADTFNINAALRGSGSRAVRGDSNLHASSDITMFLDDGTKVEYSLKWYATGAKSANAQAKNVIEAYHEYCSKPRNGSPMTFEEYLQKNGYGPDADIYMSVYNGQGRIIPSDQLQEAIDYLTRKIAKDSLSDKPARIATLKGRLETLQQLSDRLKDGNGTESMPLTKEEAEAIAALCKEGDFDAADFGISIELITTEFILQQALKAGITAAVISLVMQLAPEIYRTIDYLIKNGEIDLEQLKQSGIKALSASAVGFLRGSAACALTVACKAGKLGEALAKVDSTIIGAVTVLLIDTCVNSFLVATGKMTSRQMAAALTKEIIVSAAAIPGGMLGQALLPQLPVLGYMLGSFVGSAVAGITLEISERVMLSFCVHSGFTCFGLVEQDYTLPDEILGRMGLKLKDLPQKTVKHKRIGEKQVRRKTVKEKHYETIDLLIVERGIVGVNKIAYIF